MLHNGMELPEDFDLALLLKIESFEGFDERSRLNYSQKKGQLTLV